MPIFQPDKVTLALLPTPLHRLHRMSEALGVDLWIKRDDLTGFALGGNKARKLEYLMAAALRDKAEVIVTCGSAQSNFIRQLAAACAIYRITCACVVMSEPYEFEEPKSSGLSDSGGNILLTELLGAHTHWLKNGTWDALFDAAEDLAQRFESEGKRVFRIPVGGSSPLGAYAFVKAGEELETQMEAPDFIVTASASGSTQSGLSLHFASSKTQIVGIATDPEPDLVDEFSKLTYQLAELQPIVKPLAPEDFWFELGYVGEGYGIPSRKGQEAIQTLARAEGIFLDPIYTAKAFAGLLDLVAKKKIGGKIVFWHTGGVPALFAMPAN